MLVLDRATPQLDPLQTMYKYEDSISILKKHQHNTDTFHRAIAPVLFTAQLFGLIPVSGIFQPNERSVRFRWIRLRVALSLLLFIGQILETVSGYVFSISTRVTIGSSGLLIFLTGNVIGHALLFTMAREWPNLIRLWCKSERFFLQTPYRPYGRISMRLKIRLVAFTFFFIAFLEHIMAMSSNLYKNHKKIEVCNLSVNFIENYYKRERANIFAYIKFSYWMIFPLEYINFAMTFCWSFIDIFIMVLSIGMATRFNQLNERLTWARGKIMPETFWIEIRSHYMVLSELLQYVDKRLSSIILLSCSSNLFFICYQFFNSFNDIPFVISTVYFWLSIFFIIGRTMSTLFIAASIHDASRKPIVTLRNVPSIAYSLEVQRFTYQVVTGLVALSGKRFFFLTRKLILAVAGTVATYELVLLDEIEQIPHKAYECNDTVAA